MMMMMTRMMLMLRISSMVQMVLRSMHDDGVDDAAEGACCYIC